MECHILGEMNVTDIPLVATPTLLKTFSSKNLSCIPEAMYSISAEDNATYFCILDCQEIAHFLKSTSPIMSGYVIHLV